MSNETTMVTISILKRARDLVAAGWIKNKHAADVNGLDVPSTDPKACSFCALGALNRAEFEHGTDGDARNAMLFVVLQAGHGPITSFNDRSDTKQDDVLKMFDKAIATVEEYIK